MYQNYIKWLIFTTAFAALIPTANAQFTTTDWALHDVGKIIEVVNNRGSLSGWGGDYEGLINAEFPAGSFVEHHGSIAPFYAGLSMDGQDTMVTTTSIYWWNSANELAGYSNAPWDTVHEVMRGDTVDIGEPDNPYYENYTAKAGQDFVTRYNDYNVASINNANHQPMFIDVYQRSWAWASPPMDQFVIYNIDVHITPNGSPVKDFWSGVFVQPAVGLVTGNQQNLDDYVTYHPEHNMVIAHDAPGNEGPDPYSPMGVKILPPERFTSENITWTFKWSEDPRVPRDGPRYQQVSDSTIQSDQVNPVNTKAILSFGQIDKLVPRDTVSWRYATIYGRTEEVVLEKSNLIDKLAPDFKVPQPPPAPDAEVITSNRQVELRWNKASEDFNDPNRSDSIKKAFEGYRVYKSTKSKNGPWTLLAEFDISNNEFGQNTGLKHKFIDTGLMNNVEYFYAVTAFSKPDTVLNFPAQETSQRANALAVLPGTKAPDKVGEVAVVPNPYRGDIDYNDMDPQWEKPDPTRQRWLEQDRRIQFINLPPRCIIKIYTLSGRLVETIEHSDPNQGFEDWNLTSNVNQAVASGIYLFTVKNQETGNTQTGKFVIIK